MTRIELPIAAYGPLQSGGNVRLLARPAGGELSPRAEGQLSDIYFAGWRASEARDEPYWAFFQLDAQYWGLFRGQLIARRATGSIFVGWLALIDEPTLDRLGWQTQTLWNAAFPNANALPDPNSELPVLRLNLRDIAQVTHFVASDSLASQVEQLWAKGSSVALVDPKPEQAVAGTLAALGLWARKRSYSTWDGISEPGFRPMAGEFDLIASEAPLETKRSIVAKSGQPGLGWYMRREVEAAVATPSSVSMAIPDDMPDVARIVFASLRDRLVRRRNFSAFAETLAAGGDIALILPTVLRDVVTTLIADGDRQAAAKAVDYFVANVLPDVPNHPNLTAHDQSILTLVMQQDLLTLLAPTTIDSFTPFLFGVGDNEGLARFVENSLTKRKAQITDREFAALDRMQAAIAHRDGFDGLKDMIAAICWRQHPTKGQSEMMRQRLAKVVDWAMIPDRLGEMMSLVPSAHQKAFLAEYFPDAAVQVREGGRREPEQAAVMFGALLRLSRMTPSVPSRMGATL